MRTRDDTDHMHALYEHLFMLCDSKRAADDQTEQAAEQARKAGEQAFQTSMTQAEATHKRENTEADKLQKEADAMNVKLAGLMTETNLNDAGTVSQPGLTGSGADIWSAMQRHQREAQAGLDSLEANLDRIRRTRSRWWWLLMFEN